VILLAVSTEKIVNNSINVLEKGCLYFNLGPLIKPIRSTSSNQTPPCHSARSLAESQNLYPTISRWWIPRLHAEWQCINKQGS